MKTSLFFGLALFAYIFYFSCKTVTIKRKQYAALYHADSAYVLYYDSVAKPRFFKVTKLTDTLSFRPLVENVNGIVLDSIAGCDTEGKIYFYEGANAVHTVYFSKNEGCESLYFFVGAEKYYTRMTDDTKEWLDKMQRSATAPKPSENIN
jgi:hypothetical protein